MKVPGEVVIRTGGSLIGPSILQQPPYLFAMTSGGPAAELSQRVSISLNWPADVAR